MRSYVWLDRVRLCEMMSMDRGVLAVRCEGDVGAMTVYATVT